MRFSGRAAEAAHYGRSGPEDPARPLSRNEEMVFAQLLRADGPLKAYALLDRLHDDGLRAPMTIYRALDGLIERGLVRKIASLNAFVALTQEARTAVGAFVTCAKCGRTRSIGIENAVVDRLLAPAGMTISDVYIEAFGECEGTACSDDAAANKCA
jgi:Fur family zinc uptake transcriptional regulator